VTDCTTWGLSVALVARAVTLTASSAGLVVFAKDAENDQRGGEQRAKGNELAALGFEKIEKIARFHRWPLGERMGFTLGALVTVTTGGGGAVKGASPKP
jgi:hypothetical protein